MTLLIGALTIGLILSLLALGVYITFRIFNFPDITADGSITLGASVCAVLIYAYELDPITATVCAFLAGMAAGAVTGLLNTKFQVNALLSGILVMTALYSINLRVMGRSNVQLLTSTTLTTWSTDLGEYLFGGLALLLMDIREYFYEVTPVGDTFATSYLKISPNEVTLLGFEVFTRDLVMLSMTFLFVGLVSLLLYLFFRTAMGTAMRATGDNPQMTRAMGSNVEGNIILGVAISNGLIALSGALWAQYQGFSDVQMGIGMIVLGLASVIIGEALVGTRSLGIAIVGVIMGSVLFRLVVANALRSDIYNPSDLKLITAVLVFIGLVLPQVLGKLKRATRKKEAEPEAAGA